MRQLEIHIAARHSNPPKTQPRSGQAFAKPEKARRPEVASEMSDEDWAYFSSRWVDYKNPTNLQGEEIVLQLMESYRCGASLEVCRRKRSWESQPRIDVRKLGRRC